MPQATVIPPTTRTNADASEWTPSLAECVARVYGIDPLTESHWRVISECREEWARSGRVPEPSQLAAVSHLSVAGLQALFPAGLVSLAWILAGVAPPCNPIRPDTNGSSIEADANTSPTLVIDAAALCATHGEADGSRINDPDGATTAAPSIERSLTATDSKEKR